MLPSALAGTTVAFPMIPPLSAFSTTVPGHGRPASHALKYPTPLPSGGTTTKCARYAFAAGTLQLDFATGIVRALLPESIGGPNGPLLPWPSRVSTRRQGVIGTKANESTPACAIEACLRAGAGAGICWDHPRGAQAGNETTPRRTVAAPKNTGT